ncbi:HET-domain-containing protein [Periconia macrospinosa]|uniref:HET-domain-containing protein n=1 Tax=Periconia macrospinosa TaxID=97972 RepID=A0A2V1DDW0_9PLEO|nr:HET-domain-containing protein [Periconia macrospinosa]
MPKEKMKTVVRPSDYNRYLEKCYNAIDANADEKDKKIWHEKVRSAMKRKRTCPVCWTIKTVSRTEFRQPFEVALGSLPAVLSITCRYHNHFFCSYLQRSAPAEVTNVSIFKYPNHDWIVLEYRRSKESGGGSEHILNIFLCSDPSKGVKSVAREVRGPKVEFDLLRRWKNGCEQCHGLLCQTIAPSVMGATRPRWLIDTWTQSLVCGAGLKSYVALSYVWGKKPFFTTNKGNVSSLQRPGALSRAPLPQTISDALLVVEKIRERYCWIDALCIVQDDSRAKYAEIENMSAIFANASLTIIAAGSDDVHCGIKGVSVPRNVKQIIYPLGNGFRLAVNEDPDRAYDSPWYKRGWTFQEYILSSRRLIFNDGLVRWECAEGEWQEDFQGKLKHEIEAYKIFKRPGETFSIFPRQEHLMDLIGEYSTRELSYEEDILNAFTGVMGALCKSWKGGFLSGLPLCIFDIMLLWRLYLGGKPRFTSSSRTSLPSWSWVGWKGAVDVGRIQYATYSHNLSVWEETVIPTVQWSYHNQPNGKRVPITPSWYEYARKYCDTKAVPPPGWNKYINPNGESLQPIYAPEYNSRVKYKHPIPLPSPGEAFNLINVTFISCRTRRTWLFGGHKSWLWGALSFQTKSGKIIGRCDILGNMPWEPLKTLQTQSTNPLLEVVEISAGWCNSSEKPHLRHEIEGDLRYEIGGGLHHQIERDYYNVLWIERQGEVAYRKGLGTISKKDWEEQDLEYIDLTLG